MAAEDDISYVECNRNMFSMPSVMHAIFHGRLDHCVMDFWTVRIRKCRASIVDKLMKMHQAESPSENKSIKLKGFNCLV